MYPPPREISFLPVQDLSHFFPGIARVKTTPFFPPRPTPLTFEVFVAFPRGKKNFCWTFGGYTRFFLDRRVKIIVLTIDPKYFFQE